MTESNSYVRVADGKAAIPSGSSRNTETNGKSNMKGLIQFIVYVIIAIIIWHNFDKIVEIGDAIINLLYSKVVE